MTPSLSFAVSDVTAINNLTTTPEPVIGPNASRIGITFHNPGSIDTVVFPTEVLQGGVSVPLTPNVATLGGGFLLPQGATLFMGGRIARQGWQALAMNGTNNPLTITEQT